MRKYIITFLLFTSFVILQSATLKRFYYKDYGYINRLVFVFSSKPDYRILEAEKQIQIELTNTIKSTSISTRKDFLSKNIIIKSAKFLTNQKNILILINTSSDYYLEKSVLLEGDYKIVLDVFKSKEATTEEMHKNYASFYSTVGYKRKAHWHTKQAKLLEQQDEKKTSKPEEVKKVQKKEIITEKQILKKEIKTNDIKEVTKNAPIKKESFYSPKTFIYSGIIILGFTLLIWGSISFRKKKSKNENKEEKNGLGDNDFNINLVIILFEKGWKIPEIAREVNLSEKAVKKIKKENKDIIKR